MNSRSACRTATALFLVAALCVAVPASTAWAIDPDAGREREVRGEDGQGALAFLISFFESLWGSDDPRDTDRFAPTINASQTDETATASGPQSGNAGEDPPDPEIGPTIDPDL